MSRFLCWVTAKHTMRYHAHYHTSGERHLYQGRFKSFPIQGNGHFLTVCRHVGKRESRHPDFSTRRNAARVCEPTTDALTFAAGAPQREATDRRTAAGTLG